MNSVASRGAGWRFPGWMRVFLLGLALAGWGGVGAHAAESPSIQSSSPSDGATDVLVTTPLVIVFDRDMDTLLPAQTALGNLSIQPASLGPQLVGTWGADKRTLTLKLAFGSWPLNVTIAWTLNPDGVNPFLQIKAADGTALPKVSGSFTTGAGAPALVSVFPVDGDESVATNATVTFRFNQPMKRIDLPGGTPPAVRWAGTGIDAAKFQYTWSADGRSLAAVYSGGFPLKTQVDWELNPAGAPVLLEGLSAKPLPSATYSGGFKTTATPTCNVDPQFPGWGSYGINKRSNFNQTSAADPEEATGVSGAFVFSAVIQSPPLDAAVASGSVTKPDGTVLDLVQTALLSFYESAASEAALDAKYPSGPYTLRFTQSGIPEWVIPMVLKDSDTPPVPKIINYAEAQAVSADQSFTLRWNSFSNGGEGDLIGLVVISSEGDLVFQAPEFCTPIPLKPTDTSVVIPAGTLSANRTYNAELLFGKSFHASSNSVPKMYGYGNRLRATWFTLATGGGTTPADPAVLSNARVLPDGKAAFDFRGSPGKTYSVRKADRLDAASWPEVGTVQTDSGGTGTFQATQAVGTVPQFFDVVPR